MSIWKLPGTTIDTAQETGAAERILTPMFHGGGLVMSQVSQITGLEGYIIHNWTKRKYISPPENKKYSREQLCRILNINILKDSFSLDKIVFILEYGGTAPPDETGLFGDTLLYYRFADLAACGKDGEYTGVKRLDAALSIMLAAYKSLCCRNEAIEQFSCLDFK